MNEFRSALSATRSAQKRRRGVSLYSRYVNRPAGRVFAAAAYVVRATPNQVTWVSTLVTLAALVLLVLAPRAIWVGIAVALLLALGFALDSSDGQLARLRGGGSPAGEWLDHVTDSAKMVLVHAAVLIGWVRDAGAPHPIQLVPIGFMLVSVVMFTGGLLAEKLASPDQRAVAAERSPSLVRAIGLLPADYGVLMFSFVFWGSALVHGIVYVALFALNAILLVIQCTRWFRWLAAA